MKMLPDALKNCDMILNDNPDELLVMYHKLRILFLLGNFDESIKICNQILNVYPNNGDVLFDKACNLASLKKTNDCLKSLNLAIQISNEFKVKAINNTTFQSLQNNQDFLQLIK